MDQWMTGNNSKMSIKKRKTKELYLTVKGVKDTSWVTFLKIMNPKCDSSALMI